MQLTEILSQNLAMYDISTPWCELVGSDKALKGVSIDSRHIEPGQMFVAIKGQRVNGHEFIESLCEQGINLFMVNQSWASEHLTSIIKSYQHITVLIVDDTSQGLAHLAVAWRSKLNMPWVAVTGSCGKTSVKEMTQAILSTQGCCRATLGNQNNQLGVPLTLLRATQEDQFGVAELGADHRGEIQKTVKWVCPKVALINNVNPAHLEGFGSLKDIAIAKAEIFSTLAEGDIAVLNRDDQFFDFWTSHISEIARAHQRGMPKILSFGEHPKSDFRLLEYKMGIPSRAKVSVLGQTYEVVLSLLGKHNQLNALAALAATSVFSIPISQSIEALGQVAPIKGRLRPLTLSNRVSVIDDAYNANPGSVKQAVNVLAQFAGKKILVLGDMLELGGESEVEHAATGTYAAQSGIDTMYTYGLETQHTAEAFNQFIEKNSRVAPEDTVNNLRHCAQHFDSIERLVKEIEHFIDSESTTEHVAILVKGSRSMKMERVYELLMKQ